jgi:perosamine synthetase
LRWLGIDKSTIQRHTGSYKWDYDVTEIGYKSHMNDIQAAIGIGQLRHFEDDQIYRHRLVNAYIESIPEMRGCHLLTRKPDRNSADHLMVFQATSQGMRDEIMGALGREGYETGMHYKPNYLYSMYKDCYRDRDCPNMEQFYQLSLSLPLHMDMMTYDVYAICSIVRSVVGSYGKGVK